MGNLNKDLLIKLARLANNNPSEHEANSAARRACKLLADANYELGSPNPVIKEREWKSTYEGTWNDVKRSTEPEFRSKGPTNDDVFNWFYESFGKANPFAYEGKWTDKNVNWKAHTNTDNTETKRKAEYRVCTKCDYKFHTFSKDEPYVCGVCSR